MRCFARLLLPALFWMPAAHAVTGISVEIGQIESDAGAARDVSLNYTLAKSASGISPLSLKAQVKTPDDAQWSDFSFSCASLNNPSPDEWHCRDGRLVSRPLSIPFELKISAGNVQGRQRIGARVSLKDASFNDEAGLHAGENVTGSVTMDLQQSAESGDWQWQAEIDWQSGEVFWQPFYFASGGHGFRANGSFSSQTVGIDSATLMLKDVGQAVLKGIWQRDAGRFSDVSIETGMLDLAALYPLILKPLLEKTAYSDLDVAGRGSIRLEMQGNDFRAFRLELQDVDMDDNNGKFAFYKLNASIPWSYDAANDLRLAYEGGHLLRIPLGRASLTARSNRYSLTAPRLRFPILDGALVVSDVSAAWVNRRWHWHLRADLEPFTMGELTHALGWPRMEGKATASIPMVTYSNGYLTTDGAMHFSVFGGDISVHNLTMRDPLGIGPRLNADLRMRNLDLGSVTRTFSFGSIEGKLDGDVRDLQLVNWQPVHFDADLRSSPGSYRKKISQRAVENISALGGAGAVAAIQRSVLRFFEEFNYSALGLSCKLRGDVCEMGGVSSTPQGYVIVKGSGVPAITVLGYNERVSWNELLERLKRVTAGNTQAVVR